MTSTQKELREILLGIKTEHDDFDNSTCQSRYKKCGKCGAKAYIHNIIGRRTRCEHALDHYEDQGCDCGVEESIREAIAELESKHSREIVEARIDEAKNAVAINLHSPGGLEAGIAKRIEYLEAAAMIQPAFETLQPKHSREIEDAERDARFDQTRKCRDAHTDITSRAEFDQWCSDELERIDPLLERTKRRHEARKRNSNT